MSNSFLDNLTNSLGNSDSPNRYNITEIDSNLDGQPGGSKDAGAPSSGSMESHFAQLCTIMSNGFKSLEGGITAMGVDLTERLSKRFDDCVQQSSEIHDDEEDLDQEGEGPSDDKFFDAISDDLEAEDKTGPELIPPLASLINKSLRVKMKEEKMKDKQELYKRPKNLEQTCAPRVPKPVWDGMKKARV